MKLQEEQPCRSPRSIGHMAKVLSLPMRKVCVLPRSMVFLIGKGNPVSPPHTKREVPHAHQNSQLFARPRHFGGREYFCHDGVPGHPPGYPSPQAVDPEPDKNTCYKDNLKVSMPCCGNFPTPPSRSKWSCCKPSATVPRM